MNRRNDDFADAVWLFFMLVISGVVVGSGLMLAGWRAGWWL